MYSPTRGIFTFNRDSLLCGAVTLAIILFCFTASHAQSVNGGSTIGLFGNDVIQGRIYFPTGHKSSMRPVVKLQSDSSGELTTVADADGSFSFTRLRPDSYKIIVDGGDEFENGYETVTISNSGAVPAQGNPFDYAVPYVYPVQIYLQPKGANGLNSTTAAARAVPSDVPQTARDLFDKAVESARVGESKKAVEQFGAAISQYPNFGLAYNEMGVQYLKLGRADKAAEAFAEAVKLGPDEFMARLNYGIALLNLKKFADAEKQLRQALQRNAAAPTGHYYLALALLNQKEFEAAEAEFKISIRDSNDRLAPAHKYLGGIYWRNKQYGRAADELKRYVAMEPKAPDADKIRDTIKDLRSKK